MTPRRRDRPGPPVLLGAFLALGLLPGVAVGGLVLPVQYLALPVGLVGIGGVLAGALPCPPAARPLLVLWGVIVAEVGLSGLFGPLYTLDRALVPRDSIQYVARALVWLSLLTALYGGAVAPATFLRLFLLVLCLGMVIGVLQFVPWSGTRLVADLYTHNALRASLSVDRALVSKRVTGWAGHATGNGGIAAFAWTVAFATWLCWRRHRLLCGLTMALALLNTIASQARMGMVVIAASSILFAAVWVRVTRQLARPLAWVLGGAVLLAASLGLLYQQGNLFVVRAAYRWLVLVEQVDAGGNRVLHVRRALALLQTPYDWLFGLSRTVHQQRYPHAWIEVEPVNILVLYGLVGVLLQYLLVAAVLLYLCRRLREVRHEPVLLALVVASGLGLAGYQLFSLAYFFWRETVVGLWPWMLVGATMGAVERHRRRRPARPGGTRGGAATDWRPDRSP